MSEPASYSSHHSLSVPTNVLEKEVVESSELLGKECLSCRRILRYHFFQRDASYRDGRRDQCQECQSAPRLSTEEHLVRQMERNYYAAQRQRWPNQADYEDAMARVGKPMHHSDLLRKLRPLVPCLYITDGRIIGDLAVFKTGSRGEDGNDFQYLFYIPTGILPEFSQYEFDARDIPVRESKRGWRTVLLRLIKSGLLTEEASDKAFGKADGPASVVWFRQLQAFRNRK